MARWICAVAICTGLCSQSVAEEQPKANLLARASCTVVRYYVAKYTVAAPRRGRVVRVLRKPRLRRHDVASRCRLHKGHLDFPSVNARDHMIERRTHGRGR